MTLGQSVPQQILAVDGRTATSAANADVVLALNTPFDGIMMDSTAPSISFLFTAKPCLYQTAQAAYG
ncbi:MAG: hypothetical protein ACLR2G_06520 [Phascolarctobacterium faecium]